LGKEIKHSKISKHVERMADERMKGALNVAAATCHSADRNILNAAFCSRGSMQR